MAKGLSGMDNIKNLGKMNNPNLTFKGLNKKTSQFKNIATNYRIKDNKSEGAISFESTDRHK